MKFFNRGKKKEENARLRESEIADFRAWFQEQLDDVEQTKAADEKLLKLEDIKASIDARMAAKNLGIAKSTSKKEAIMGLGGAALVVGGITGAVIATGGLATPVYFFTPGLFGSLAVSGRMAKSSKKRLLREASDFVNELQSHKTAIVEIENKLLEEHLSEIAASPSWDVLSGDPDLKSRFADAAAKKATEGKATAEAPPPKPKSPFDNMPKF